MLRSSTAASSSSSRAAASPDVITITDDEDEDDDSSMSEPSAQPQQPGRQAAADDDEAGFFDAEEGDAEPGGEADDDWGDMTEVNDEADIDALPAQSRASHASTPSTSRRLSSHDAVGMESCPRDVMRRIEADVREIGLLPSFCASDINFGGRTRVALRVGFPVQSLGMNAEQVRAWTLSNDMDLFVELHFPPHYWSVAPSAIDVTVGQSATRTAPTDLTPLERCRLSWPLEHRIRKQFLPDLLHDVKPLPVPDWSWADAEDVVGACDCGWLTAIGALVRCKGDQSRAIEEIMKEQAGRVAQKTAGSKSTGKQQENSGSAGADKSFSGMLGQAANAFTRVLGKSNRADDKQDKQKEKKRKKGTPTSNIPTIADTTPSPASASPPNTAESHVMAACSVSLYVARRGLAMCNGDAPAAMELLCNEETVADLESEERSSASAAADSTSLPPSTPGLLARSSSSTMSFSSDSDAPQSDEDQLLALLAQHNYLVRLLRFIKRKIHNIHSTCILCEKRLDFPGLNLSVCQSSLCRMSYESMGVGFDIGTAIAAAPLLTDLYISMLASATGSSQLYYAKPLTVSGVGKDGVETNFILATPAGVPVSPVAAEEKDSDKGPLIDYAKLLETVNRLPPVAQMVDYIRAGTFVEKMNQLDVLILPLLRWLFQSCPTYVRELTPAERFTSMPTPYQFVMLMSSPEKEHRFQQLKAASGKESIWSWHGGPARNWHSIIRSGLKNLSNSKYMQHGAAYGSGIYMASDSVTSLGYSGGHYQNNSSYGWTKSAMTTNPVFLALCEVVGDAGTFNPYLVVPDCLTGDHQVLTRTGWQSITRVQRGDAVMSFNTVTHAVEWKSVIDVTVRPLVASKQQRDSRKAEEQRDLLYRMQCRGMDIIATRDHRMLTCQPDGLVKTNPRLPPIKYQTVADLLGLEYAVRETSTHTKFVTNHNTQVIRAGVNLQPHFKIVITDMEAVCEWWWQQDGQAGFLSFVGFWLGDGGLQVCSRTANYVLISQKKEDSVRWLGQLMASVFPNWHGQDGPDADGRFIFRVRCPPLYNWLRLMCIGPVGYNPCDTDAARAAYPHFTPSAQLAAVERQSAYYQQIGMGTWSEDEMLRAMRGEQVEGEQQQQQQDEQPSVDDALPLVQTVQVEDDDEEAGEGGMVEIEVPVVDALATEAEAKVAAVRGRLVHWNSGLFYVISGHWFYLKRWLGDAQQMRDVWSKLSRHQATCLLYGFGLADGLWDSIEVQPEELPAERHSCSCNCKASRCSNRRCPCNKAGTPCHEQCTRAGCQNVDECEAQHSNEEMEGESASDGEAETAVEGEGAAEDEGETEAEDARRKVPTGKWRLFNSSRPLLDHLSLIAALAGAAVTLTRHKLAGTTSGSTASNGTVIGCTADHWELALDFKQRLYEGVSQDMKYSPLAQPQDVTRGDSTERGYFERKDSTGKELWDDSKAYCITVESKHGDGEADDHTSNFLTQRLCWQRNRYDALSVKAHPVFVGNCEKVSTRCLFVFGSQQTANVNAGDLIKEMHRDLRNFDVQAIHKRR